MASRSIGVPLVGKELARRSPSLCPVTLKSVVSTPLHACDLPKRSYAWESRSVARISPRWSTCQDFLAQMNLVADDFSECIADYLSVSQTLTNRYCYGSHTMSQPCCTHFTTVSLALAWAIMATSSSSVISMARLSCVVS